MSRVTTTVDRIASLVMAVLLVGVGLLAIDWGGPELIGLLERSDTDPVVDLTDTGWWPWALGGAGTLLVLLGLRWLWAHLRSTGVARLNLPGTSNAGRLRISSKAAASAAGQALADTPWVRTARGRLNRDRGQLVVDLRADLTPDADLQDVARACDRTAADLARVLRRRDLHCRVHLSVRTRGAATRRVQ